MDFCRHAECLCRLSNRYSLGRRDQKLLLDRYPALVTLCPAKNSPAFVFD
jgi:hypothetical protein